MMFDVWMLRKHVWMLRNVCKKNGYCIEHILHACAPIPTVDIDNKLPHALQPYTAQFT